jgi:hypothetical protein
MPWLFICLEPLLEGSSLVAKCACHDHFVLLRGKTRKFLADVCEVAEILPACSRLPGMQQQKRPELVDAAKVKNFKLFTSVGARPLVSAIKQQEFVSNRSKMAVYEALGSLKEPQPWRAIPPSPLKKKTWTDTDHIGPIGSDRPFPWPIYRTPALVHWQALPKTSSYKLSLQNLVTKSILVGFQISSVGLVLFPKSTNMEYGLLDLRNVMHAHFQMILRRKRAQLFGSSHSLPVPRKMKPSRAASVVHRQKFDQTCMVSERWFILHSHLISPYLQNATLVEEKVA